MADAATTTYGFIKVEVGASENTWGGKLNNNFDDIDDCFDGTTVIKPSLQQNEWQVAGTKIRLTGEQLNNAYHRANILAAVALSSGVPTGGIIERTSGSLGEAVRFADGTQMVFRTVTPSAQSRDDVIGGMYRTPAITYGFHRAFNAGTDVFPFVACEPFTFGLSVGVTASVTEWTVRFARPLDWSGTLTVPTLRLGAIGRWD